MTKKVINKLLHNNRNFKTNSQYLTETSVLCTGVHLCTESGVLIHAQSALCSRLVLAQVLISVVPLYIY